MNEQTMIALTRNGSLLHLIALMLCMMATTARAQENLLPHGIADKSRVILLGEPTHGEGNVFEAKTRIVQYLHDSLGFNIIAFESGFYDLYHAQQLIERKPQTHSGTFINEALFPIWTGSKQFQPFLDYFEQHKKSFRLAGFDYQISGSYGSSVLVDSLLSFIKTYQPQFKADEDLLREALSSFEEESRFPEEISFPVFQKEIKAISSQLDLIGRTARLTTDQKRNLLWLRQATGNIAVSGMDYYQKGKLNLDEKNYKAEYSNTRDSMMAANVLALLELYPDEKIICWGAGTHFMNDPSGSGNAELARYKPMGMYLKKALGKDQVYNLSFISDKGQHGAWTEPATAVPPAQAGSIEALAAAKETDHFINLQAAPFYQQNYTAYALEYTPLKTDWSQLFDAFIYLKTFSPSTANNTTGTTAQSETTINIAPAATMQIAYTGTITDATTKQPIPFATVVLSSSGRESAANNNGVFSLIAGEKASNDSITAFYYGYKTITVPVTMGKDNAIALQPLQQMLAEVAITAAKKPMNAKALVQKVKEHIAENYGSSPFYQYCYFNSRSTDYDAVILDIDYVGDLYTVDKNKVSKFNLKEIRTNARNTAAVKADGLNRFYPSFYASWIDIVRDKLLFTNNRYKQYEYKLLKSYQDDALGEVWVLGFKATNTAYKFTRDYFTASMEGQMSIRMADYAVIEISYESVRDVNKIRKWVDKYYDDNKSSPLNMWSVLPDKERIRIYCRYSQDKPGGRYYPQQGNYVWFQDGHRKQDSVAVSIISDLSFYKLAAPQPIEDLTSVPFGSFQFPKAQYNAAFWNTFPKPKLNEYATRPHDKP